MLNATRVATPNGLRAARRSGVLVMKALAALLCAFIAWEIILELTTLRTTGHVVHPQLGMIFAPGYYRQGTEGFCSTRVNSLGMRNGEIRPKPASAYRIMALGDSYTEGFQVGDDETYCALLQRQLAGAHRWVEVVNAGREGGSPVDYVQLAGFYRRTVTPDFVILQLNERDFTHDLFNTAQSYYLRPRDGGYDIVASRACGNPLEEFARRLPAMRPVMGLSTLRIGAKKAQAAIRPATDTETPADDPQALLEEARAISWITERLHAGYPRSLVVYLPTLDYTRLSDTPSFTERQLQLACAVQGIPFLSLRTEFARYYRRHHQPANGFDNTMPGVGHINRIGHRLTAAALADFLAKERLP